MSLKMSTKIKMVSRNAHSDLYPRATSSNPISVKILLRSCFILLLVFGVVLVEGMQSLARAGAETSSASRITENPGHAGILAGGGSHQETLAFTTDAHGRVPVDPRNTNGDSLRGLGDGEGRRVFEFSHSPLVPKQPWIQRTWKAFVKGLSNFSFSRSWFKKIWNWIIDEPDHHAGAQYFPIPPHSHLPAGTFFAPGQHVGFLSIPSMPVAPYNQMAAAKLGTYPIRTELPSSAYKAHVHYLPGRFIRTVDHIGSGDDSLFKALAEIKYKDQGKFKEVKEKISQHLLNKPEALRNHFPDHGKDDGMKVSEYMYGHKHSGEDSGHNDLVLKAFSEVYECNLAFVSDTTPAVTARQYYSNSNTREHYGLILDRNKYELLSGVYPPTFHPGEPVSLHNVPSLPITQHNHMAYHTLSEKAIPNLQHLYTQKTQVDYLPGRYIRTEQFIPTGPDNLYYALAQIKHNDYRRMLDVKDEIAVYMKKHRKIFEKHLPTSGGSYKGQGYEDRVTEYVGGVQSGSGYVHDLALYAFAKNNKYNMVVVADRKTDIFSRRFDLNPKSNQAYGIILDNHNYELLGSV